MGYSEIASRCGFPTYWRPWGDFVDRRFLERGFGINQIYFFFSMNLRNLHSTQEAGKWWAFLYEILIIIFFHSQIFPYILKVFQSATGILWIVVSCKKIVSLMFVSFFYLLMILWFRFVSALSCFDRFCCVSFRFVSCFTITHLKMSIYQSLKI